MTEPVVLFSIDAGVASITLNRPAVGNAMSRELTESLLRAIRDAEADPDCRVVVLRGAGRVFCGGGDLNEIARKGGDAQMRRMVTTLQDTMFAFAASPLIIIAAVGGAAAGAGLGLVLNTDIVLASTRASFHGAYGAIGLTPDGGVSYLLPAAIGSKRASAVLLTGSPASAADALAWGLVAEVLEPDALDARADELAARLVAGPTQVFGPTKKLLGAPALAGYRAHLDAEAESVTGYAAHPDTQKRIRALLEKAGK
ncbi:enoyl-CoA hydratase/isomerase family protein [Gryllotalpicola sp.]|uniref:enoyl-CoA hydratase/isomerase family protein n=1 Tax=Gryllotalpicola sp. TaxID=1932787 RepID=UPI00262669E5|nr:enoyl-CoA hydratase/isomerase family protein [Gryllotalpicola sp.]